MADEATHPIDSIVQTADTVQRIRKWFNEAKVNRDIRADRWRKNEKLYYGRHWEGVPSKKGQTKMVFNYPLSNIESVLPVVADFLPTVDIMPMESNDVSFAEMMTKRFTQISEVTHLYDKILGAVKDSLIYSNGFIEVMPDISVEEEDGEEVVKFNGFNIETIDPYTVMPDPFATDMELKEGVCRYIIFAVPMYLADIKAKYGVDVQSEGVLDEYRAFQVTDEDDRAGFQSEPSQGKDSEMALVIECYYRDADEESYPNGRITAIAGDKLLVDEALEIPRIPYFMVGNYKSPHSFYGIGEPELVRTQTKATNEIMSSIADNIKKTGNPPLKISKRAQAELNKNITGQPGERWVSTTPEEINYAQPPSIPNYIQTFVQQVNGMQDSITGVQDVTQGRQPTGVTAAKAITALQEAAQTRIRYKITKEITKFIKDIGNYMVQLIQVYDTEIRSIRERSADGSYEFTQFDPETPLDKDGNAPNSVDFDPTTAKTLQDSNFDIEVAAGFKTPSGRVANEERALNLYQLGIYGIERIADALNEPNKQELIQEFYQRQGIAQGDQAQIPPELIEEVQALMEVATPGSSEEQRLAEILTEYPELQEALTGGAEGVS